MKETHQTQAKLHLFLALLPPQSIQTAIANIQQYFSDRYDGRKALERVCFIATIRNAQDYWHESSVS
jgi:hypothetical protein